MKMYKPIIHSSWLDLDVKHVWSNTEFTKKVEIFCDRKITDLKPKRDTIKVLILNEPREILPHMYDPNHVNLDDYDLVFTWDQPTLSLGKKHVFNFIFFHCWMWYYGKDLGDTFPEKEFSVSTVVGMKSETIGHIMRHDLWSTQFRIEIPKRFFASGLDPWGLKPEPDNILGPKKDPLFKSQFHICIENIRQPNMVTEKLHDAIISKTVPIYWGAPNIGDIYDTRGMFVCHTLSHIYDVCNNLTPTTYEEMKPFIQENYQRALALRENTIDKRIEDNFENLNENKITKRRIRTPRPLDAFAKGIKKREIK